MPQIKFKINVKEFEIFRALVDCVFTMKDIGMYFKFKGNKWKTIKKI